MTSSGSDELGETCEATQVAEERGNLTPMAFKLFLCA